MNSKKPTVSICIPTYNRPEFLLQALRSCFSQTYKDYEIVISDNSESNETKKVVLELKNKKIRYYKNPKNIGSFNNLIKVVTLAKGRYIKFLLDDDLLSDNCIEAMVKVMNAHENIGVVCSPLRIIDGRGRRIYPKFYFLKRMMDLYKYCNHNCYLKKEDVMIAFLTKKYPCCVPTGIMYRKECFIKLGTFDAKFKYIADLELLMRIATKYDFYYIDKYLSSWRYTPSSETVSILHKKGIDAGIFYDLTKKYLQDDTIMEVFPKKDRARIIRNSYLFASKRTILNILAGLKSKNMKIIITGIYTIWKKDPYIINKIKCPFVISREIMIALIPGSMLYLINKQYE
jgi:glycosyltransferase involved in cell wall biosynthesis